MPSVAVLISVYANDSPVMFDAALRSVIGQRVPPGFRIRIYLGVDGPIPSPLARVIEVHREHIHALYRGDHNVGLAPVLNRLISMTTDEVYLFRMDADDRSLPDRFLKQINYLEEHKDIDILGTAIVENDLDTGARRIVRFASGPDKARRDIAKRTPLAHPTACFRAGVFAQVGGYPAVLYSEDVALWFECLKKGLRFNNLDEPLYEFTITSSFWKRRGFKKAWREYLTWSRGVWELEGLSWNQLYPMARLGMRIGPQRFQKLLYRRFFRHQTTAQVSVSDPESSRFNSERERQK